MESKNQKKPDLLNNVYPKLAEKANQLVLEMKKLGYTIKIISGYRSLEAQQKIYAIGRFGDKRKIVTNAKPGSSYHNYGLAFDVCFVENGVLSWDEKFPWRLLGETGKKLGLEWGGDFKFRKDRPHFQISKGVSWQDLLVVMKKNGLKGVFEFMDKQGA